MADNKIAIEVTANTAPAVQEVGKVSTALTDLAGKEGPVNVTVDTGDAVKKIDQIDAALAEVTAQPEVVKVSADTAAAISSIDKVDAALDKVTATPEVVKVTVDTGQAVTGLSAVEKRLDAAGAEAQQLQGKTTAAGQGLAKLGQSADAANTALDKTNTKAAGLGQTFGELGPLVAAAFGGRELIQTITQADSLQRGLVAIAGSSKAAAEEMAFIRKTSKDLGLELNSTGQAYLQLTAATKGTEIEGQKTRDIFVSITRAMSVLGKSTAETDNALRAVSQIASKGTVSMEELRGQLGEALPGALKAAADGMGVTTQELFKMVESGDVLAKDLLPALAANLDSLYAKGGSPDSLVANFNRFKNAVSEVAIELGESGLTKALGDVAVVGAQAVGVLGSAFVGLGKGIGNVAGAIATLDFKPMIDDLGLAQRSGAEFEQVMFDAAGNVIGAVDGLAAPLERTSAALVELGSAASDGGNKAQEAFRKSEIAAQNAEVVLTQAAKNAIAQFDKLRASGDTAAEAVGKIGKDFDLSNAPGIKNAASVLDKLLADGKITADQFSKQWSDGLKGIDLADFAARARSAFSAGVEDAARLQSVLDQGLREAVKRAGLDFEVISGGMGKAARSAINDTQAIITGLDGLKKQGVDTALALTASIGKSINTADSQKAIEAVRQQIEGLRKVLGDKITDGLLDQAKQKALELGDAADKALPGINSLREAMTQLGITSDNTLKKTAASSKEAYDFMLQKGTSSTRELSAAFAKSAADAIAANNGIAPSWVTLQAAARGFEVQIDSAGKAILTAMGNGKTAMNDFGTQVRETTADLEKQAAALDKINAKYGQSKADREAKYGKVGSDPTKTSDGFAKNKDGSAAGTFDNTLNVADAFALVEKSKAGKLTAADLESAKAAFQQAQEALNYMQEMGKLNPGGQSFEFVQSTEALYNAAKLAYEKVQALAQAEKDADKKKSEAPAPSPGTAPAPAPTTHLVKIDFSNGKTATVNTASANDSQNLIGALQMAKLAAGY